MEQILILLAVSAIAMWLAAQDLIYCRLPNAGVMALWAVILFLVVMGPRLDFLSSDEVPALTRTFWVACAVVLPGMLWMAGLLGGGDVKLSPLPFLLVAQGHLQHLLHTFLIVSILIVIAVLGVRQMTSARGPFDWNVNPGDPLLAQRVPLGPSILAMIVASLWSRLG